MATITINSNIYVNDHYEIEYTVDGGSATQLQVYADNNLDAAALQTKVSEAYTLTTTGVDFANAMPIPAVPSAPTAAEQAIIDKRAEVETVLQNRFKADYKTKKAEEIALRIGRTETYIDATVDATLLDAMKADLKSYATTAAQEYKAANDDYDTKRAELDVLLAA